MSVGATIGILLVVEGGLLATWAILRFFERLQKDIRTMGNLVQKVPLPPRRSTVDIMANPRPLPGTLQIDIHPAEDLDGQWIAHVHPVDIITQGNSMVQAIEAAAEAVGMCLEDDQANGLDFWERGAAWREQQCEEDCEPLNIAVAYGIPLRDIEDRDPHYEFDVTLVEAPCRLKTIKLLKELSGRPLFQVKEAVDRLPLLVAGDWSKEAANQLASRLRETGAVVETTIAFASVRGLTTFLCCTPESPCLDTESCDRCRTFPTGSGG